MLSPVRVPYEVNYYIEVCTEPNMQNKNNNGNLQNHCTKENAQTNWRERQFANIVHKSKQSKHLKVQLGPTVNYEKKVYVCHVFAYSCPAPSPWSVGWDPPWMTRKCMSVTLLPAPPSSQKKGCFSWDSFLYTLWQFAKQLFRARIWKFDSKWSTMTISKSCPEW